MLAYWSSLATLSEGEEKVREGGESEGVREGVREGREGASTNTELTHSVSEVSS